MKCLLVCLFSAMLLGSIRADNQIEAEDFRVYEAALADFIPPHRGKLLLVFSDRTDTPGKILCLSANSADFIGMCELNGFAVDHALAAEFFEKNQKQYPLPKAFHLMLPATIKTVSAKRLDTIFTDAAGRGWQRFYRAYPKSTGIIYLSRVAYSSDGQSALVYVGRQSAGLSGGGVIYLLKRQEKDWRKVSEFDTWIS